MTAGPGRYRTGVTSAVTRPGRHVAAVRADADQAARDAAERTGAPADTLIGDTIDWALGQSAEAPFTRTPAPPAIWRAAIGAEISACSRYLQSTPWSKETDEKISQARDVLEVLEWLAGITDQPPVYTAGTQPGDLTGGRGPVVRTADDIAGTLTRATRQASAGDTAGWGSGPGWHAGVIATLAWASGGRAAPPMDHPGPGACTHPAPEGLPSDQDMRREQLAAEEHLQPGGYRHGDHSPGYADAVVTTIGWLYGETTQPPVHPGG